MTKYTKLFSILALFLVLLAAGAVFWLIPKLPKPSDVSADRGYSIGFGDDTVKARVLDILEESTMELANQTQSYQILLVKVPEGEFSRQLLEIDYGLRQIHPPGLKFHPGDQLLVTVGQLPDGTVTGYFTDYIHTQSLLWMFGTFFYFFSFGQWLERSAQPDCNVHKLTGHHKICDPPNLNRQGSRID